MCNLMYCIYTLLFFALCFICLFMKRIQMIVITFNCKKTVCIKFGGKTHDYEHLILNGNDIEWVSEIKHLGNNLNISRNDELVRLRHPIL